MPGSKSDKVTPLRKAVSCPQCNNPSSRNAYPFCSKRCGDIDLGAWLNGSYSIAASGDEGNIPEA